MVDTVHIKSFKNATGYILNVLFISHDKSHNIENCLRRFSLALLFAITAKVPARSGKTSDHTLNESSENPERRIIKNIIVKGLVAHVHLFFFEKTASIKAVNPQAIALVKSP